MCCHDKGDRLLLRSGRNSRCRNLNAGVLGMNPTRSLHLIELALTPPCASSLALNPTRGVNLMDATECVGLGHLSWVSA
jgi:hypothetical protein